MTAAADRGIFILTFVKAVIVQPDKHVTFKTQAARVEGPLQVLAEHGDVFRVAATGGKKTMLVQHRSGAR